MVYQKGDYTRMRLRAKAGDLEAKAKHDRHLDGKRQRGPQVRAVERNLLATGDKDAIARRDRRNALERDRSRRDAQSGAEEVPKGKQVSDTAEEGGEAAGSGRSGGSEAAKAVQGILGGNQNGGVGGHVDTVESDGVLGDGVGAVDWEKVLAFYGRAELSSDEEEDEVDECDSDREDQSVEKTASVEENEGQQASEATDSSIGINLSYPTTRFGDEMFLEDFSYLGKVPDRADLKSEETIQMEALRADDKWLNSETWQQGLARRYGDSEEDE